MASLEGLERNFSIADTIEDLKNTLSTGEIGYAKDTGSIVVNTGTGFTKFNSANTTAIRSDYYAKPSDGYYGYYDTSDLFFSHIIIDKELLEETVKKEGFIITSQKSLLSGEKSSCIGWTLIGEESFEVRYKNFEDRETILQYQSPLENGKDIEIAIIERNAHAQIFISPECKGTQWELEEFREIFVDLFEKYTSGIKNKQNQKEEEQNEDVSTSNEDWMKRILGPHSFPNKYVGPAILGPGNGYDDVLLTSSPTCASLDDLTGKLTYVDGGNLTTKIDPNLSTHASNMV